MAQTPKTVAAPVVESSPKSPPPPDAEAAKQSAELASNAVAPTDPTGAALERLRAEQLKADLPKAPVKDPSLAGQPTDNIPDPRGLEGAPVMAGAPGLFETVTYTVPEGDEPEFRSFRQAGIEPGRQLPAFVQKVHPDGAVDLLTATGQHLPRVFQSDGPAGAERSRGKWSPQGARR